MIFKTFITLTIEYHWYIIKLLKRFLNLSKNNQFFINKITTHKTSAEKFSIIYEILVGIRNADGEFQNCVA